MSLAAFDWPSEYDEAIVEAKAQNKDIYLFIGSESCPYCTKMKENVFSDKELMEKLKQKYVYLYLSRDGFDDIPEEFETKPVPRHYFLDKTGKVIYTTIGGRSVEGFYEMLEEVEDNR
jgi:thioredoxin-related protein